MKAFKIAAFILALLLCFSGCSWARNDGGGENDVIVTEAPSSENTEEPVADNEENETVAGEKTEAENNADGKSEPKLYYAMQAEGELNTSYHIEGCKATDGIEIMEINSGFVTMIGLNPCSKCNPPKF